MSAPTEHTTVMLMLFVTTPWDPITARAKMDFLEMEKIAPILMSVPTEHTTVMLMLFVPTPWDLITASAEMDFTEMEKSAPLIICNAVWFNTSLTL